MQADNFIPSWLTSWVAWRNFYTEPGEKPFNVLIEQLNLSRMPKEPEFTLSHGGRCPYCHGDAVLISEDLGLIYCICKVLDKIERLSYHHSLVGTSVKDESLDSLTTPSQMGPKYQRTLIKAKETVEGFIKRPSKWMYIYGYYGTGKTHILKAVHSVFKPMSLYVSARDLETKIHEFRQSDDLGYFYDVLINAPILILDDIGMEYGGRLLKTMLEKVIDARYEAWPDLPIVMASNMRPQEVINYIKRASDRLFDKERSDVILLDTLKSYRDIMPEIRP